MNFLEQFFAILNIFYIYLNVFVPILKNSTSILEILINLLIKYKKAIEKKNEMYKHGLRSIVY